MNLEKGDTVAAMARIPEIKPEKEKPEEPKDAPKAE
jgi:hypothetical protein